jgi:hypothetical protein
MTRTHCNLSSLICRLLGHGIVSMDSFGCVHTGTATGVGGAIMTASSRPRHCPTCHCRPDGPDPAVVELEIARLAGLMGTTLRQLERPVKPTTPRGRLPWSLRSGVCIPSLPGHGGGLFARDHSTVIHALKKSQGVLVEQLLALPPDRPYFERKRPGAGPTRNDGNGGSGDVEGLERL